ncbi:hypothetical protein CW714_06750 [Methanophagales archaeon]|nr:MAG: hypothetical protein CW714_06750 [Methanophagales archaeon]
MHHIECISSLISEVCVRTIYGAPSCYHGSVEQGWEVVEKYKSGQKDYEKADTVPVMNEEKEKLRAHKTSHYTNFLEGNIKKNKTLSGRFPNLECLS